LQQWCGACYTTGGVFNKKNLTNKIKLGLAAIGAFVLPMYAMAASSYSTTTADTDGSSFISDIGQMIKNHVPEVLVILAALVGLAFVVGMFRRHVAGRKF